MAAALGASVCATAATAEARSSSVSGQWVNALPCVPTGPLAADPGLDPAATPLECVGSSTWTGTFRGVTTFRVQGIYNLVTGELHGTIDEWFAGSSSDGRRGTLTWHETIDVVGGALVIEADILRGTGSFGRARGQVRFTGTTLPTTNAYGDYAGRWRPGR